LASSSDPRVRVTAIHYLADAVDNTIARLLSAALDDSEARVRWTAVQTIERRNLHDLTAKLCGTARCRDRPNRLVNL
jgi:HEAT repeat protein